MEIGKRTILFLEKILATDLHELTQMIKKDKNSLIKIIKISRVNPCKSVAEHSCLILSGYLNLSGHLKLKKVNID